MTTVLKTMLMTIANTLTIRATRATTQKKHLQMEVVVALTRRQRRIYIGAGPAGLRYIINPFPGVSRRFFSPPGPAVFFGSLLAKSPVAALGFLDPAMGRVFWFCTREGYNCHDASRIFGQEISPSRAPSRKRHMLFDDSRRARIALSGAEPKIRSAKKKKKRSPRRGSDSEPSVIFVSPLVRYAILAFVWVGLFLSCLS